MEGEMTMADAPTPASPPRRVRRARTAVQDLGSIVLGFELVIVFLGALVLFGLKALPAPVALTGGAIVVVAMGLTIPLLRYRWAVGIGWALQLVVIAAGFLVPAFFIVGAIFTALWAYCMVTGARLERAKAAAGAAAHDPTDTPTENTEN
jgi:hypothetical protein